MLGDLIRRIAEEGRVNDATGWKPFMFVHAAARIVSNPPIVHSDDCEGFRPGAIRYYTVVTTKDGQHHGLLGLDLPAGIENVSNWSSDVQIRVQPRVRAGTGTWQATAYGVLNLVQNAIEINVTPPLPGNDVYYELLLVVAKFF